MNDLPLGLAPQPSMLSTVILYIAFGIWLIIVLLTIYYFVKTVFSSQFLEKKKDWVERLLRFTVLFIINAISLFLSVMIISFLGNYVDAVFSGVLIIALAYFFGFMFSILFRYKKFNELAIWSPLLVLILYVFPALAIISSNYFR